VCPLKLDFIRILLFDDFRHLVSGLFGLVFAAFASRLIQEFLSTKFAVFILFMVSSIFQGLTLIKIVFFDLLLNH
jgi:hypothetical protein